MPPRTLERSRALRRNMTDAERKLWFALRYKSLEGARFRRQYPIGDYIVDFCCPGCKLIIEVDGGQHADAQDYDERRTRFLESRGFGVLRFWNGDVLANRDGVVEAILESLAARGGKGRPPS